MSVLEELNVDYATKLDAWLASEANLDALGFPGPWSAAQFLDPLICQRNASGLFIFGVAGRGLCYALQSNSVSAELHCSIFEGEAKFKLWIEALSEALAFIFTSRSYERVHSIVASKRVAKALRKLGVSTEGELRNCRSTPSGLRDGVVVGITRDEWLKHNGVNNGIGIGQPSDLPGLPVRKDRKTKASKVPCGTDS